MKDSEKKVDTIPQKPDFPSQTSFDIQVPSLGYSSIEELHVALSNRRHTPRDAFDYLMANERKLFGSEAEYHNLSVEFSNQNNAVFAGAAAKIGADRYPLSTTLIADYIKYAQMCGKTDACRQGFEKLLAIDRKYWDWRTFVFSIDYLKDSMGAINADSTEKETKALLKEHEDHIATAKELIQEFKNLIPHEERSYVAEAEIFIQQSKYEEAVKVLEDAIQTVRVAPQCCMKLADIYLEQGKYSGAIAAASKGILATLQDAPTTSTAYLYYVKALGMDALRMQDRASGQDIEKSRIEEIMTCYLTADRLFVIEGRENVNYRKTIMARLVIIQMEEYGQTDDALLSNIKDTQADQMRKIREFQELMTLVSNNKQ